MSIEITKPKVDIQLELKTEDIVDTIYIELCRIYPEFERIAGCIPETSTMERLKVLIDYMPVTGHVIVGDTKEEINLYFKDLVI